MSESGTAIDGDYAGVAWRVAVESTNRDTVTVQIGADPTSHRARFVTVAPFGSGPAGDIFSTWPQNIDGSRWVVAVLSAAVREAVLRCEGVEHSIVPVEIATDRIPQLVIFPIPSHPAELDLYGGDQRRIATLRLDDPRVRRDGVPLDHTAPAPVGTMVRRLGG